MKSDIHQHGTLEQYCRDIARQYGWNAEATNRDVDPLASTLYTPAAPGRGDLVLSSDGHQMSFEYELPEDPDIIRQTIEQCIKGNHQDADRRMGHTGPIRIGD